MRRIHRRDAARRKMKVAKRQVTDAFLAEVEAALEDPECNTSYRKIAADLGMHHTSLAEMVAEHRKRQAEPPQAVDF